MAINKSKLIGGVTLVAEGATLAYYGTQYLDFMQRQGLMSSGKRLLRATGIRSGKVFAAIGIVEVAVGILLLTNARSQPSFAA